MITALTTLIIIVQKRVRQSRFSPPWGGYCTFGIFAAIINTGQYYENVVYQIIEIKMCLIFVEFFKIGLISVLSNRSFIFSISILLLQFQFVYCYILHIDFMFLFVYRCTKLYMYDSAGHGQKLMIERKISVQYLLSIIETLVSYCFL